MGSDANRLRKKWQNYSRKNAGQAEKKFFDVFNEIFKDTVYKIRPNQQNLIKHMLVINCLLKLFRKYTTLQKQLQNMAYFQTLQLTIQKPKKQFMWK